MSLETDIVRPDDALYVAFVETSLPFSEWTHIAHLRVAYVHLDRFSFNEALCRMRKRIKAYNRAHNVPTTPTDGYHETITVAYMSSDPHLDSLGFLACHSVLAGRRLLERHYSRELLFSASARKSFVAPDRRPLPAVPQEESSESSGRRE